VEKLTFTVDSALLNELGERLVESAYTALIELVKNSYDADATHVQVTFSVGEDDTFVSIRPNRHFYPSNSAARSHRVACS